MSYYTHALHRQRFWKTCLLVALTYPELSGEDVEFRAVLVNVGLVPL